LVNTRIKTPEEIENIKKSGQILTKVLDILVEKAKPGISSLELDKIADEETRKLGGIPTFLGYQGFPGRVCVSVNNEIVHAIPSSKKLQKGDLVVMHNGVSKVGMITDEAGSISFARPTRIAQK